MSTQGISLNGTSQSVTTGTIPSTSIYSAIGSHQYIMRVSNLGASGTTQMILDGPDGTVNYNGTTGQITCNFNISFGGNMYLPLGAMTDVMLRFTFNNSTGIIKAEVWDSALTVASYLTDSRTMTSTAAADWRGNILTTGSNYNATNYWTRMNVDFLRVATTLSTTGAANPPTYAYDAGLTYLWRWEFETNLTDSGPNGLNLTPTGGPGYVTMPNVLPTASAVTSASAYNVGATVTLNGSGSIDPDGTLTYAWTQTAGPTATLSSSTAVSPTFTAPSVSVDTILTFHLVVTDNNSATSSADVSLYDVPVPVANAGPDINAKTLEPVVLRGDLSSVSAYQASWTFGDGETNQKMARATHAYMVAGTYTATLTVTSRTGSTSTDTATVTITDPGTGGTLYTATSAADFQTKLNLVVGGDVIEIAAGSNFNGNFNLPIHTGSSYVTIRVQNFATNFTRGKRVSIADVGNMAKLSFTNNANHSITTDKSSSYWRFQGIQFEQTSGYGVSALIAINIFGMYPNTTIKDADLPTNYIFDHVRVIQGAGITDTVRGIAMEAKILSVVDSEIMPFIDTGFQSQALWAGQGSGPFAIVNNHLQATGENIMFGGDDPNIAYQATMSAATSTSATLTTIYDYDGNSLGSPRDMHVGDTLSIPIAGTQVWGGYTRQNRTDATVLTISGNNITFTDCGYTPLLASAAAYPDTSIIPGLRWNSSIRDVEITKNYLDHLVSWRGTYPTVNLFETKNAEHVYLSRNIFENEWYSIQQIAIMMKGISQYAVAPASTARDIHLVDSMVRHICGGFASYTQQVTGPTAGVKNHSVYNVLFDDIDHINWGGTGALSGIAFDLVTSDGVDIRHVTAIPSNTAMFIDGTGKNLTFKDNITGGTLIRNGGTAGESSLIDIYGSGFEGYTWDYNTHVLASSTNYPQRNNRYPASVAAIGFTDAANGDYTLTVGSAYHNTASDGTDPGVNMVTLATALGANSYNFNSATFKPITGDWTGGSNLSPTVNAGTDQSLSSGTTSTTLTGTASDPEGDPLTKTWTRVSGPNTPTIVTPTTLSTSVTGMIAGTYIFRLTVNDGVNADVADDVQVIIAAAVATVTICRWDTSPSCITA